MSVENFVGDRGDFSPSIGDADLGVEAGMGVFAGSAIVVYSVFVMSDDV